MTRLNVEECRYCGRGIGDAFAGGPDDVAPGVCPMCLKARMAVLMVGAQRRLEDAGPEGVATWLRAELHDLGIAPRWIDALFDLDFNFFDAAHERLNRR